MITHDVEFYNITEMVGGSFADVLLPDALQEMMTRDIMHLVPTREKGEGTWLSRIPNDLRLQLNPPAQMNGLATAGCEIRFNLESDEARFVFSSPVRPMLLEVYQGAFPVEWYTINPTATEIIVRRPERQAEVEAITPQKGLPFDANLTRVILPRGITKLLDMSGEFSPPRPEQTPTQKLLMYGSSITHGGASIRPTGSYALRTNQLLGTDAINLGFGGGAHLEREIADYIAERNDWDLATLEMGINILGIEVDDFRDRVDYFVSRIVESHPDTPVFCIDVFYSRHDWEGAENTAAFRGIVRDKVAAIDSPCVIHVPGQEIPRRVDGLSADLVHPAPSGMEEMARALAKRIGRVVATPFAAD